MKICFDVDVIVDIFGKGEHFVDSFVTYDIANLCKMDTYVCAVSLPTIWYVLYRRGLNRAEARALIATLRRQFDVIDVTAADCAQADESAMDDYEDAVIAHAAYRVGADFIITRNKKDFADSPVPALTPSELNAIYKPTNYEYDVVELTE